jgi:hypothetical protein
LYVDKMKLKELMAQTTGTMEYPEGCYRAFARILDCDVGRIHRLLNSSAAKGGAKFLGKVKTYCEKHGLDFNQYISLS